MEFIRGLHNLRPERRGTVLTIGNYDGVHLGHRAVLDQLAGVAAERGLPSTVTIFEPTPQEHFAGLRAPARLTRLREKLLVLTDTPVDRILCLRFDARLASMSAHDFVGQVLNRRVGARHILVGDDFRFGRGRQGDVAMLRAAAPVNGFDVAVAPTVMLDGHRVSSTAVRAALVSGDFALATRLLGRPYRMGGRVIEGNRLGRTLGYPTANMAVGRRVSPLHGIFAVRVAGAAKEPLPGVSSLGTRPTVDGTQLLLEVHLFDVDLDLYGRRLEVEFVARLRDEAKFASLDALTEQMHADAAQARSILGMPGA